jgi:hypothetical protein
VDTTKGVDDPYVTTDLNTLLTARYVKIDDWLGQPRRVGRPPRLSDAELLTIAVTQALLTGVSLQLWQVCVLVASLVVTGSRRLTTSPGVTQPRGVTSAARRTRLGRYAMTPGCRIATVAGR